ncbi:16S rRNA (cytidine(1402)-2'-O)-methyltransferase [Helicobacter sp. 13S00477-4]|uniref:16S rRNA (cytidine(1402)-2'-O)-methyltransferase n=1 Tax=Helicobacter sp. 13S00477-4 TaxID=1905759 RepID=UPI000BA6577F|nr:16S rRNA (cytidine(1402)-2'-O)-methyltransferase [Helicobacter sp. 13S00477-4]PAF52785.1 16S rRNA (cytidine(1402)-2'-O)-methyltransferase [Helicobacter sp. 13S00477-4]
MLTFLPTPIGNLADVTIRTLQVLAQASILMCEDIRVSKRLVSLFKKNPLIQSNFSHIFVEKEFVSFHSHNEKEFLHNIQRDFFVKNNVVFMSDAGMPCVSDPGMSLVAYAIENNITYDVLPGPCAAINAYCFSGIKTDGFLFGGFLPPKQQDRKNRIINLLESCARFEQNISIILYESPHRILESLEDIASLCPDVYLYAIKEMTKIHQKYFVGLSSEVFSQIKTSNISGEWVLVLKSNRDVEPTLSLHQIQHLDIPPKIKAKILGKLQNADIKSIYKKICEQSDKR